jgi:hypothetical protein
MRVKTSARTIYRVLRSVKLTAGLLIYLAAALAAATLIPQAPGMTVPEETSSAGGGAGPDSVLAVLGLTNFYISAWFILPLGLFFLNLLACAVHRIRGELKRNNWRHYGPDIIHVGILFIIISAVISLFGRQEGKLVLAEGETGTLANGYSVTLLSFSRELYDEGSVKEWRSRVRISAPGGQPRTDDIIINHPVAAGHLSLYQISYGQVPGVVLADSGGNLYTLLPRETIAGGDQTAMFLGMQQDAQSFTPLVIMELQNGAHDEPIRKQFGPGDEILPGLILKQTTARTVSVIQAGYDPGFFPLLISFFMTAVGLGITFYQRLRRRKNT